MEALLTPGGKHAVLPACCVCLLRPQINEIEMSDLLPKRKAKYWA